jgi:TonB family protein
MQNRRQKQTLKLPFVRRRRDPVTWIYDHRAGIFSLLALAMTMAILFIGSRIVIRTPEPSNAILVDLKTVEQLQQEVAQRQRENRALQDRADARAIQNAISNQGAEEGQSRTDMSAFRDELDRTNQNMRGNREAWERGNAGIEAMKGEKNGEDKKNVNNDTRARGTVSISFSLVNPTRYSAYLYMPGYRCERGGEVTVRITVNRGGDVVAAEVDKGASTNDVCMHDTALDAARRSRFDVNTAAPERHTGTITYLFIPQ